jgi:hypothetical protein
MMEAVFESWPMVRDRARNGDHVVGGTSSGKAGGEERITSRPLHHT